MATATSLTAARVLGIESVSIAGIAALNTEMNHRGRKVYAQQTANQTTISTVVDLTGLTAASFTAVAGRLYRISAYVNIQSTVANDVAEITLLAGGTVIQSGREVVLTTPITIPVWRYWTGSGATVFKVQAARVVGTGTLTHVASATAPGQLIVEDIGPV